MTLRILAVVAEAATAPACLDAAEAAAHALGGAAIEALHVVVDPDRMVRASEELALQQLRERYEGSARHRAEAVHAAYETWLHNHPDADIPFHWKELVGAEQENLVREALTFDMLVLARPTNMDGRDALHAAFFAIRHPFFLVPSQWRLRPGDSFSEHIIIAWSGADGCARAVQGALPWLQAAIDVTLLLIGEDDAIADPLKAMLDDEHVLYRVHSAPRNHAISLGDQIVREACNLGADLLVMGAYRHSEFIEWLLGGTTRHVLARCHLPLLMAH